MSEANTERLAGRITQQPRNHPYGFIQTDDGQKWFYHVQDCVKGKVFVVADMVEFTPVRNAGGKNPRAIRVEAL